jgi:hypothetical protein
MKSSSLRYVSLQGMKILCHAGSSHSVSNPWLVNLSVRLFSVTMRTTFSGAPSGTVASISSVTVT